MLRSSPWGEVRGLGECYRYKSKMKTSKSVTEPFVMVKREKRNKICCGCRTIKDNCAPPYDYLIRHKEHYISHVRYYWRCFESPQTESKCLIGYRLQY
jgi:hypothetical protein